MQLLRNTYPAVVGKMEEMVKEISRCLAITPEEHLLPTFQQLDRLCYAVRLFAIIFFFILQLLSSSSFALTFLHVPILPRHIFLLSLLILHNFLPQYEACTSGHVPSEITRQLQQMHESEFVWGSSDAGVCFFSPCSPTVTNNLLRNRV